MSKRRKTVDVGKVLKEANRLLALPNSDHCTPAFRKGVAALLESTLHDTGNYAGYNYLHWLEWGFKAWQEETGGTGSTANYLGDETRRVYYSKPGSQDAKVRSGISAEVGAEYPCALQKGA